MISTEIEIYGLQSGFCRQFEWCVHRDGKMKIISIPIFCTLLRHPVHGWILFDTGYSPRLFEQMSHFPDAIYGMITPTVLPDEQILATQLKSFGIEPTDIAWCIISHFHADHVAGLRDLPAARFIALSEGVPQFQSSILQRIQALRKGIIAALIPPDFFNRFQPAENAKVVNLRKWMLPFSEGLDLFGDGSLLGVRLPGHAAGQMGLLVNELSRPVFLSSDACWSLPACERGSLPPWPASFLVDSVTEYVKTFFSLQSLSRREKELTILPAHCGESWRKFSESSPARASEIRVDNHDTDDR